MRSSNVDRIHAAVKKIPKGRVATYGQIARVAGLPGNARQVGAVLGALPDEGAVPWQRVINSKGEISPREIPDYDRRQRALLRKDGVAFSPTGTISLARFQWNVGATDGPRPGMSKNRVGRPRDI